MKRLTFAGHTLITGDRVVAALLDYAQQVSGAANNAVVDIPVLEPDGSVRTHTLVLGATMEFDISEADGHVNSLVDEDQFFIPHMPPVGGQRAETSSADAEADAENFNRAVESIDSELGSGT
jgi:hypothetical protein